MPFYLRGYGSTVLPNKCFYNGNNFFWLFRSKAIQKSKNWKILAFSQKLFKFYFWGANGCILGHAKFQTNLTTFKKSYFQRAASYYAINGPFFALFCMYFFTKFLAKLSGFFFFFHKLVEILHDSVCTHFPLRKEVSSTLVNKWRRKSPNVPTAS